MWCNYAEAVTAKGFVFMDTPGYDPVSATGQVAGGANLVCFTTGRGSVFGCKPAPSIKLATNTPMYQRMEDDMDVNCGTILDGDESVQQCGQRIFELMLRVASGERDQERAVRLRRGGVRAVGAGRDDVGPTFIRIVMAGLGPAIHVFVVGGGRRGLSSDLSKRDNQIWARVSDRTPPDMRLALCSPPSRPLRAAARWPSASPDRGCAQCRGMSGRDEETALSRTKKLHCLPVRPGASPAGAGQAD